MKNDLCPKCSSAEITPNAEISYNTAGDLRHSISAAMSSGHKANKLVSKVSKTGEMRAWICGECGFTEVYTLGMREISADYKQS